MYAHDVFTENVQRVARVCFTVKQKVCGVKVDSEVARVDGKNGPQKRYGCFLSRFEQQILPVVFAVLRDFANRLHDAGILVCGRVFGQKSHVSHNVSNVYFLGKIRPAFKIFYSLFARPYRHKPQSVISVHEIPDRFAFPAAPQRAYLYSVFTGCGNYRRRVLVREPTHVPADKLAGFKTVLLDFLNLPGSCFVQMDHCPYFHFYLPPFLRNFVDFPHP